MSKNNRCNNVKSHYTHTHTQRERERERESVCVCFFVIDGLTDRMTDRQVVRQIQKDKPIYGWMKGQTDRHEETI